ncbi:hypothetical protein BS50DRAFT_586962 [Corynespora cassiicola Philippines]|uniref:Cupredoxin n=1 Tax=Corynespora cassiicola Philippines TaxID=1448308 RepID=A0A2T2NQM0_CORCC|nr:hypothetical protein BS50DRAFT_586962 [Corynespora cassiicola Philippines]
MHSLLFSLLLASTASALPRPGGAPRGPRGVQIKAPHQVRASAVIPVVVGGPQDLFVPNSVTANVGDIVQFQFSNGNHTVTQSTADAACAPMEGGVHSGHIPFEDGQTEVGTFNMPVTSTEPMFLYCATGPHCQTGQVMMINPADTQQLAAYAKLSQESAESVDGSAVVGGTAATIPLDAAAFTPAAPEEEAAAPPPAEAPPAEAPPAEAPPAEAPPAEAPPAEAPPAEAPPAEAPPAEAPPAEEAPAEAPPAEGAPAEEAPAEAPPAEAPPAEAAQAAEAHPPAAPAPAK